MPLSKLADMGYRTSLEYIGENTIDRAVCQAAAEELKTIIRELNGAGDRVCFDLSHIGLSVDTDLAYRLLTELAEEALRVEAELLISMEESAKTDRILDVYRQAASRYPNIGITLQAHLHRTRQDLADLSHSPRRIRIVKGAFREPEGQALPRSAALNDRYLELVHDAIRQGHHVSIATHDEQIINEAIRRGWLDAGNAEFDMLYGFRPGLAAKLRAAKLPRAHLHHLWTRVVFVPLSPDRRISAAFIPGRRGHGKRGSGRPLPCLRASNPMTDTGTCAA